LGKTYLIYAALMYALTNYLDFSMLKIKSAENNLFPRFLSSQIVRTPARGSKPVKNKQDLQFHWVTKVWLLHKIIDVGLDGRDLVGQFEVVNHPR
jgi:hypothetical protein